MRSSIALNVAGSNTLSAASIAQAFVKPNATSWRSVDEWFIWLAVGFHVNSYFFNMSQCNLAREVLILNVQMCMLYCTLLYCTCMTSIDVATWSSCLWFHKQYHDFFHCHQDFWTIQNQAPSLLGGFLRAHKPNEFGDCCIGNTFWRYIELVHPQKQTCSNFERCQPAAKHYHCWKGTPSKNLK